MLTLAWVESQIEDAINGSNSPQNVRDFALLCIARDNLLRIKAEKTGESPQIVAAELINNSADLNKIPTIKQANNALKAAISRAGISKEEAREAKDLKTWANIIEGSQK